MDRLCFRTPFRAKLERQQTYQVSRSAYLALWGSSNSCEHGCGSHRGVAFHQIADRRTDSAREPASRRRKAAETQNSFVRIAVMQSPSAPPRFYWTKELDLRLVHAIKEELGPEKDLVKHQRKEGTVLAWQAILQRLQGSTNAWPTQISTIDELRKRWDNSFRVWYAKAIPDGSIRANILSLSKLLELLTNRDYVLESKPGPKKGSKSPRKKRRSSDDSGSAGEEGEEEEEGIATQSTPKKAKPVAAAAAAAAGEGPERDRDTRLESWLSILENPQFHDFFRVHSPSGDVVMEPKELVDLEHVPFSRVLALARAMAASGRERICDLADRTSIKEHLAVRKPFYVFPTMETLVEEGQKLLLLVITYDTNEQRHSVRAFFSGESSSISREEVRKLLGVGEEFELKSSHLPPPTVNLSLVALYLFSNLQTTNDVVEPLPSLEEIKRKVISSILLQPGVSIIQGSAKNTRNLPYKSLSETITSLGIRLPPWCMDISRESLLNATRDLAKVVVMIIPWRSDRHDLTWKRSSSDERELVMIAEKADHFGAVLRIRVLADPKQALISVLSPFVEISGVPQGENMAIDLSKGLAFSLDQRVEVCLKIE